MELRPSVMDGLFSLKTVLAKMQGTHFGNDNGDNA